MPPFAKTNMKVLILDDSVGRYFIFGGPILDTSKIGFIDEEINNSIISTFGSKIPHYEIQADNKDNLIQYQDFFQKQEAAQNTNVLDFTLNSRSITQQLANEVSSELKMKIYKIVNSAEIEFVLCISKPVKTRNNVDKLLGKYVNAIDACCHQFEKYLKENNEEGMVLIDEIGGSKSSLFRKKYYEVINPGNFSKLKAIFPGVISNKLFSINNVVLNGYQSYFGCCEESCVKKIPLDIRKELRKIKLISAKIYPAGDFRVRMENNLDNLKNL